MLDMVIAIDRAIRLLGPRSEADFIEDEEKAA